MNQLQPVKASDICSAAIVLRQTLSQTGAQYLSVVTFLSEDLVWQLLFPFGVNRKHPAALSRWNLQLILHQAAYSKQL